MPFDLFLTIGLVILLFAIPSVVSAVANGRPPRIASIMVVLGGGLVMWAVVQKPGGYSLTEIPDIVVATIGHYVH